eukprot:713765-Pelagomonas_calceolata.AAC.2
MADGASGWGYGAAGGWGMVLCPPTAPLFKGAHGHDHKSSSNAASGLYVSHEVPKLRPLDTTSNAAGPTTFFSQTGPSAHVLSASPLRVMVVLLVRQQ